MTSEEGRVAIIAVTDRQFDQMVILYGAKEKPPPPAPLQLELF